MGPGYRITERQSFDEEFPSQMNYELIASGSLEGTVQFTESFSIGGNASIAYGEENTNYNFKGILKEHPDGESRPHIRY